MANPVIRFIIELKSEKLVKALGREFTETETVELLPTEQQEYWAATRQWVRDLVPDAVFGTAAGVLITTIEFPRERLAELKSALRDFKPFQITKFTRAGSFSFFPEGLGGPGYGKGLDGSIKKYFELQGRKASLVNRYWE